MPRGVYARKEVHSDDTAIDQKPDLIGDLDEREPEIILVDKRPNKEYLDELAFNEEPVKIRIEPSAEKNAASAVPFWVNGKGCEVYQNGRWNEIAYVPVGQEFITKRKYVAVMASAKYDRIETIHDAAGTSEIVNNKVSRFTSAVASFSILEDKNPRGAQWLQELRRRNF